MSSPTAIPKPTNAGAAQIAIADTRSSFANIRNGPGEQYADIGDLRDNSLCQYYPATRTSAGWVWVEITGVAGWVSTGVVTFENVVGGSLPNQASTPYDGKTAIWHWKGTSIPEKSIAEFVGNVKRRTPNVKMIWVKTSDGIHWQGRFDQGAGDLAINSTADIDRWVNTLNQNGLEFHAWCVPQGLDIEREAQVIAQVCNRPGVRSMILDVEPYAGFWQGGRAAVRPFMVRLRQLIPAGFHIGMSMDPRPWHYESIFPMEWFPFVNSLHPQSYWATFRNSPEATLKQTYDTWGNYGRPIIPALQADANLVEQEQAHTLATARHKARGLSWWRYGVISQYGAVNLPINITITPPQQVTDVFAEEIIVTPKGTGFRSGTYTGRQEFQETIGTWGWTVLFKKTEVNTSTVWAEWRATLPESGRYEIAVFVPAANSTTGRARYKIHGIRGTTTEVVVDIDQQRNRNRWVTLGIFELVKGAPNAGKVFLNDVTGEGDKVIAFDAVRFRRIVTVTNPTPPTPQPPPPVGVNIADGFDSPVGTAALRAGAQVWPQGWRDATGFGANTHPAYLSQYNSYHTGVDLNFGSSGNADIGEPVCSIASGVVIYQADLRPWGNVTIVKHDPFRAVNGPIYYSRYGHMQNVGVRVGQRVTRGQKLGEIGTGGGRYIAHLHFDISPSAVLERSPGDWPGRDLNRLLKDYVDPLSFIRSNRPRS